MMEDRQFDELVRGLMENGAEEVPAGLWSAVESGLPAEKTKVVPLWFKWTGAAVAAAAVAAAVVLAVVLPGRGGSVNPIDIADGGNSLAENTGRNDTENRVTGDDEVNLTANEAVQEKSLAELLAAHDKLVAKAQASETVVTSKGTEAEQLESAVPEPEETECRKETESREETRPVEEQTVETVSAGTEEKLEDSFDEGGRAVREPRSSGFSLTLSGNASSNTNPKISGNSVRRSFRSTDAPAPSNSTIIQTDDSVFGVPLAFCLGFRYNFNERWSVGSGFNFTILSRSFAGDYIKVGEDGVAKSAEHYSAIRNNQVYFGVPVYAFCNIITNRVIDFYAYAGGEMDKCIYNKYLLQSASGKFGHEEKYKGLQWSVKAGLGVEFIVTEDLGIFVDPQVGWYFKNKKEYGNIWNYQPLMFGVNLGLRLRI